MAKKVWVVIVYQTLKVEARCETVDSLVGVYASKKKAVLVVKTERISRELENAEFFEFDYDWSIEPRVIGETNVIRYKKFKWVKAAMA